MLGLDVTMTAIIYKKAKYGWWFHLGKFYFFSYVVTISICLKRNLEGGDERREGIAVSVCLNFSQVVWTQVYVFECFEI